jgi:hypothetical protein
VRPDTFEIELAIKTAGIFARGHISSFRPIIILE